MNNLLPKSEGDFSETAYWEHFFKTRPNSFEWYGEYLSLLELFLKYVKTQDNILVVGCGNSTLSEDLYLKHKCQNVISIDTSATAINQMIVKNKKILSPLGCNSQKTFDFICMDASDLSTYKNISNTLPLSCVIDKGTTDAIHSGGCSSAAVLESMWSAIEKSLTLMGRYILITLAQEHIVESIVNFFTTEKNSSHSWMINVHELATSNDSLESFKLPIFAFVFYKMKYSPSLPLVYIEDNAFSNSNAKGKKTLLKSPKTELVKWVLSRQRLSMLCNTIKKADRNESEIDMVSPQTGLTRYHCVLAYNKIAAKKKSSSDMIYCVFIVPLGHDRSPIFDSERSRLSLMNDHLKCRVCLFVYLNQREYYQSKLAIQDELHSVSLKFCPEDAPVNYSIPVISSTEQVCASEVCKTESVSVVVETVVTDDSVSSRRLVAVSATRPVLMATVPLSKRDVVIEQWIKLLPVGVDSRSLYLGRPWCLDTLDHQWTVLTTDFPDEVHLFSKDRVSVLPRPGIVSSAPWHCIIHDLTATNDKADHWSAVEVYTLLSETGVMVLCGDEDTLAEQLSPMVRLQCRVSETFARDMTYLWVLSSRTDIDLAPLRTALARITDSQ